jgi:hypothetical protein
MSIIMLDVSFWGGSIETTLRNELHNPSPKYDYLQPQFLYAIAAPHKE